ncbi:MAG: hypothetical protein LBJ17_00310, partial [Dysgonamonadaceae bacterium]|nr:hypothetical protein [Dysgonamonadaceae bacterium]
VLINKDGNLFNGKKDDDQVDCIIIHPETHYVNNRPHWLISVNNRKEYQIEKFGIAQYPLLVLAYRKNEFENNGVPADLIEVLENENVPSLVLSKGGYEVIIKDRDYNIINRYDIKIE